MSRFADLHTHTTASDGSLTPDALVRRAAEQGLAGLAITDHDTVAGLAEAQRAADEVGVDLLTGVELSVHVLGHEVHLLAYGFDPSHPALLSFFRAFRQHRETRGEGMVAKLGALGVPLSMDDVREVAGDGVIGRPHVARALQAKGVVETPGEAFDRFIGEGQPAYVPKPETPAADAIALVRAAGGITSLAHPGEWTSGRTLRYLVDAGMEAIEARHPSHAPHLETFYRDWADRKGLLATGGSDFHGWRDYDAEHFGRFVVPYATLAQIRERAAARRAA